MVPWQQPLLLTFAAPYPIVLISSNCQRLIHLPAPLASVSITLKSSGSSLCGYFLQPPTPLSCSSSLHYKLHPLSYLSG